MYYTFGFVIVFVKIIKCFAMAVVNFINIVSMIGAVTTGDANVHNAPEAKII